MDGGWGSRGGGAVALPIAPSATPLTGKVRVCCKTDTHPAHAALIAKGLRIPYHGTTAPLAGQLCFHPSYNLGLLASSLRSHLKKSFFR